MAEFLIALFSIEWNLSGIGWMLVLLCLILLFKDCSGSSELSSIRHETRKLNEQQERIASAIYSITQVLNEKEKKDG